MDKDLQTPLLDQLNDVLKIFQEIRARAVGGDILYANSIDLQKIITTARAAIERIGGRGSTYVRQTEAILSVSSIQPLKAQQIIGIIESLKFDLQAGYIHSVEEIIHSEMFADFLEMAQHLSDEGYKDAAAVIAGSSLELHLRQLCHKHEIDAVREVDGSIRPKKANMLNNELDKAGAYSKTDQKSITAWLDLRNKAAHGRYDEYEGGQVSVMIAGIRDFLIRNPA